MEAMILAAGLGTRLRSLTKNKPKALVEVAGRPMLARVMDRLIEADISKIIINTHHHESQIRAFLETNTPSGIEIALSPEPDGPYDTGGGLFAAASLFTGSAPFLLHNVDVLSDIPLRDLLETHVANKVKFPDRLVASLAVRTQDANRTLLFDDLGLVGWESRGNNEKEKESQHLREPVGELHRRSFTGIHIIEPKIFGLTDWAGKFSIITLYLELAAKGHRIAPIDVSGNRWIDVGTVERLEQAERDFG